ncbi:hypothetical protein PMAYCL1PPCAC_01602, partial [Pristionchus mayeri]
VCLVFILVSLVEARVKLTYSEFIDGEDLKTASETDFTCPRGCMIYSGTENPNLVIINKATQQEITTLNYLAFYNNEKDKSYLYGMTLMSATYTLKNKAGLSGATFGLYVVANDAPNYGQTLRIADAFYSSTFNTTNGVMTIMTRGTGIRMVTLNSEKEMTPRIFATGYDAITNADQCQPLYTANSLSHAQQSQIDIIGPIATIRFDGLPGSTTATVKVGGDIMTDAPEMRNSLTISSPGYNGCKTGNNPVLYQYNMNKLDRRFVSDLEQRVNIHVAAKTWLPVDSDTLTIIGLQDQPLKLMGEVPYNHDFPVSKVDVRLTWQRLNYNSNFAIQMDATKSAVASSLLIALSFSLFFAL